MAEYGHTFWRMEGMEVRDVGVTLEVRLHRFVMSENERRESGKNPRVGNARRRIRI